MVHRIWCTEGFAAVTSGSSATHWRAGRSQAQAWLFLHLRRLSEAHAARPMFHCAARGSAPLYDGEATTPSMDLATARLEAAAASSSFGMQCRSAFFLAPCHSQAEFLRHLRLRRLPQTAHSGVDWDVITAEAPPVAPAAAMVLAATLEVAAFAGSSHCHHHL